MPRWPVRVTRGHRGHEGAWVVAGGKTSFDFWGQALEGSERTELSEALNNLPRRLFPFCTTTLAKLRTACPEKQGQLPAAHTLLQISPRIGSGGSRVFRDGGVGWGEKCAHPDLSSQGRNAVSRIKLCSSDPAIGL